jgi:hypothetical protein
MLKLNGEGKMGEINKQFIQAITVTASRTFDFKWISGDTEPATPAGYVRASELDINLGDLGRLWAFAKLT